MSDLPDASKHDGVTLRLRELVLSGEFAPGKKLRELQVADRLGVSRTPVRLALGILAREGLLDHQARRGFSVREITPDQIFAAFEVRGALEGLAARLVASHRLGREQSLELEDHVLRGNTLLEHAEASEDDLVRWASINADFHSALVRFAKSRPLTDAIAFNARLPLVSPGAIAFCQGQRDLALALMKQAQSEHAQIVDSLQRGQVDRAHALVIEHTYQSREFLKQLLAGARTMREIHQAMQRFRIATTGVSASS